MIRRDAGDTGVTVNEHHPGAGSPSFPARYGSYDLRIQLDQMEDVMAIRTERANPVVTTE